MPLPPPEPDLILYDGDCGFCHRWVRFAATRDRDGRLFRFAPRSGDHAQATLGETTLAALPPSIVVQTHDGQLLLRSDAVLHILRQLGGTPATLAAVGQTVPRPLRDLGYRIIARIRHHLPGPKPQDTCPILPPPLQTRFFR